MSNVSYVLSSLSWTQIGQVIGCGTSRVQLGLVSILAVAAGSSLLSYVCGGMQRGFNNGFIVTNMALLLCVWRGELVLVGLLFKPHPAKAVTHR